MSVRALISALPGEVRAAWLEGERVVDLLILREDRPSVLGNVYRGKVLKLDRGLNAAFVEIGLGRPAFLSLADAVADLTEGQTVVVQVTRAPAADKGAKVTGKVAGPVPPDAQARPPACLTRALDPLLGALVRAAPEAITVDDPATFAELKGRLAELAPELAERTELDPATEPLFERFGIEGEIEGLLEPRVDLPSGGHLLIEPVRTLTAIDVNAGRHAAGPEGRGASARLALAVDLEAAEAIPRQLRLRALGGLVVVDFLELRDRGARDKVVTALREGLRDDPEPTRVFPMAPSGLVELTRRRGRPALHELLTEPCGIAGGGRVKDPVTVAYEALRAARRAALVAPGKRVGIVAAPAVIDALEGPVGQALGRVAVALGRPPELRADPGQAAGFEIELE